MYKRQSYGRALVAFEQAAAGLERVSDIVDTLSAQATTFALQGDAAAARSSFDKALALDPGFRLPADAAPRARKVFDDVAKAGQGNGQGNGQRNGELTVYASTGAAEVWVDGVMRGATPLTVDVPVGRHLVRVHRDGYRAWGGAFDVKRNAETTALSLIHI